MTRFVARSESYFLGFLFGHIPALFLFAIAYLSFQGSFPIGVGTYVPATGYLIRNSQRGYYALTIRAKDMPEEEIEKMEASPYPDAVIVLVNDDNLVYYPPCPPFLPSLTRFFKDRVLLVLLCHCRREDRWCPRESHYA